MVGARFRRNEAKPRRRLLLIRAWGARAFVTRAPLAADGVGAVEPVASGSASSLVAPSPLWMLRPDGDVGAAVPLAPELRFGAAGLGRRRILRPPDASSIAGRWGVGRCGVAAAGTVNAVGALP